MPSVLADSQDNEAIVASFADPSRFSVIFDRHFKAIHRYLQRQLGPDLADELSSQTFLVAFDKRESFDASYASSLPWLYGIAANLVRRHRRDVQRQLAAYRRLDTRTQTDPLEGIEARADAGREREALIEGLRSLSHEHLEAILLHSWAELSYAEIAQTLDLPLGTVQSRINRGRKKLREQVGRHRLSTSESLVNASGGRAEK